MLPRHAEMSMQHGMLWRIWFNALLYSGTQVICPGGGLSLGADGTLVGDEDVVSQILKFC